MRRCKSSYVCFMGALFLISLYNFVALTVVVEAPKEAKEEEMMLEENVELELDADNPHVFQSVRADLEEMEMIVDPGPEPPIFWPNKVELPLNAKLSGKEETWESCQHFRRRFQTEGVGRAEKATWNKCGRPTNAYAELTNGEPLCVRHREKHHFLIAGEILSYQLSQMLSFPLVPCATLIKVDESEWKTNITALGWKQDDVVALIEWHPIPRRKQLHPLLRRALKSKSTLLARDVERLPLDEQMELAQWSDLIVFDYLIGQYDRIASHQDEAEKQNDSRLLDDEIRNLGVDEEGTFWVYDNEAGLLDGYILLYESVHNGNHLRFQQFHSDLLNALCVFRKNTVHAINNFYQQKESLQDFLDIAYAKEPLLLELDFEADVRFAFLERNFRARLTQLIGHWKFCSEQQ